MRLLDSGRHGHDLRHQAFLNDKIWAFGCTLIILDLILQGLEFHASRNRQLLFYVSLELDQKHVGIAESHEAYLIFMLWQREMGGWTYAIQL
jgi:hypothetical protein